MKEPLLIALTAVALCAADTQTLEIKPGDLPATSQTAEIALATNGPVILTIRGDDYGHGRPLERIDWHFSGTNLISSQVITNIATNWYPVAYDGSTNRIKQVGELQTNRIKRDIYAGRTWASRTGTASAGSSPSRKGPSEND